MLCLVNLLEFITKFQEWHIRIVLFRVWLLSYFLIGILIVFSFRNGVSVSVFYDAI
jgi:hypothetical protein